MVVEITDGGFRPDGYIPFQEGLNEGLKDEEGNIVISPDLGYRTIGLFDDGVAIGFRLDHKEYEGGWGLLDERGNKLTEFKYWFVERFAADLFLVYVTPGLKKNVMRRDGKLIFAENYDRIYGYKCGYMIAGNTIRKTKTTPTRYPEGVLHENGEVVLPVEFREIIWNEETGCYGGVPYEKEIIADPDEPYNGYIKLLEEFVSKELDGDINKLKSFDLRTLKGGDYKLVPDAICALVFKDVYGNQMFDTRCHLVLHSRNMIHWNLVDIELENHDRVVFHHYKHTEKQKNDVRRLEDLWNTIGNLWIDPKDIIDYKKDFYFDKSMANLHYELTNYKYTPRKQDWFLNHYLGEQGVIRLSQDLLLDYFFDYYGNPEPIFDHIKYSLDGTTASDYFRILAQYIKVCEDVIPHRSEQIIRRLKNILN